MWFYLILHILYRLGNLNTIFCISDGDSVGNFVKLVVGSDFTGSYENEAIDFICRVNGENRVRLTVDDADVVGRVYRFLGSDKVSPRDIEKLANSFNKAGNYEKWRLIVSGYFDEAFTKALADNMGEGLNMGSVFHKAIVGSPKARSNFTEMMWQLARQKGNKITKTEMAKAIDSFAAVLKATGRNAKVGSPTASRTKQMSDLEKNLAGRLIEGVPVLTWFKNLFNDRTLSKNSELFANTLTSDKGIAAFVDLAQNWKDPARAIATLRAIATGGQEIIE